MSKAELISAEFADPANTPGLPVIIVNVAPSDGADGVNIFVSTRIRQFPNLLRNREFQKGVLEILESTFNMINSQEAPGAHGQVGHA